MTDLEKVTEDGFAIQFIKNPSEEVQIAAVTKYGYAIEYIKNPTLIVRQIVAVGKL